MERKINHCCSVCGKQHHETRKALDCLMSHPLITAVNDVTWTNALDAPSQVQVELSDGRVFAYYLKNQVIPKVCKSREEDWW